MTLIPVENKPGIFRDSETNAIVNKNTSDYDIYVRSRNKMKTKEERIGELEKKVDHLSGLRAAKVDLKSAPELIVRLTPYATPESGSNVIVLFAMLLTY